MAQHVVIRKEEYFIGSEDKPEPTVFTQTHRTRNPVPFGRIKVSETLWMKWSGGPIVAKAQVEGFRLLQDCTPEELRNTVRGTNLFNHTLYWESLPKKFNGMTIYITDAQWLDKLIQPEARSYGSSWVVLDTEEKKGKWLSRYLEDLEKEDQTTNSRTGSLPVSIRFKVLKRDNFMCAYCGRRPPEVELQVDHVMPRSKGGSDNLDNLTTACSDCNLGKSDHLL